MATARRFFRIVAVFKLIFAQYTNYNDKDSVVFSYFYVHSSLAFRGFVLSIVANSRGRTRIKIHQLDPSIRIDPYLKWVSQAYCVMCKMLEEKRSSSYYNSSANKTKTLKILKRFLREAQLIADFRFLLESEPNLREKRGTKRVTFTPERAMKVQRGSIGLYSF